MPPIVDGINSTVYKLSKYLNLALDVFKENNYSYLKNSLEFMKKLDNIVITDDMKLVSLNVESLFTNIPIKIVIDIISKNWLEIVNYTKIKANIFIYGIKVCMDNGYFKYKDKYYKQLQGKYGGLYVCQYSRNVYELCFG